MIVQASTSAITRYRFSLDEYHAMGRVGIFDEDSRVELLEGDVYREGVRYRFNVNEYHKMIEAGIFGEDDRVELIHGEIYVMSPINPRHAGHVNRLVQLFYQRLGNRVLVGPQNPIQTVDDSEPQPDVTLLIPRHDSYSQSHPTPADVLLVVEVADSTLEYDRNVKAPLYARAGIRELWLVNLIDNRLEVYRDPDPQEYRERRLFRSGDTIAALAFPETTFSVAEILG
jgi:Uma2 family endonuclease